MDWGSWAVVRDMGQEIVPGIEQPNLPRNRPWTTVEFTDLRFNYSFMATRGTAGRSPLTGWACIVDNRDDAGEAMDGRAQN